MKLLAIGTLVLALAVVVIELGAKIHHSGAIELVAAVTAAALSAVVISR